MLWPGLGAMVEVTPPLSRPRRSSCWWQIVRRRYRHRYGNKKEGKVTKFGAVRKGSSPNPEPDAQRSVLDDQHAAMTCV